MSHIVFSIFPTVKLNTYWRNNTYLRTLQYALKDFYVQPKNIRAPQTNFTFSLRPLKSLLAIFKNTLELEEWTNRNQEFSHRTNRKRRGPQNRTMSRRAAPANGPFGGLGGSAASGTSRAPLDWTRKCKLYQRTRRGLQREAESSCYPAGGGGQATGLPPPRRGDLYDCWELAGW